MRKLTTSITAAAKALAAGLTRRLLAGLAEWQLAARPLRPVRVHAHPPRARSDDRRFNGR